MQTEWIFLLKKSDEVSSFLNDLLQEREQGTFLGSTYPEGFSHSCFTKEQVEQIQSRLDRAKEVQYRFCSYYSGNLEGSDFGIKTFRQPFVQWCPTPVYCLEFDQEYLPKQHWGLAVEEQVVFDVCLRSLIAQEIKGLKLTKCNIDGKFDAYSISEYVEGIAEKVEEKQTTYSQFIQSASC